MVQWYCKYAARDFEVEGKYKPPRLVFSQEPKNTGRVSTVLEWHGILKDKNQSQKNRI